MFLTGITNTARANDRKESELHSKTQELIYRTQINKAIQYIHANLDQHLKLVNIARASGFSPFHFHRLFSAFVGETPGMLIRRTRLERSVRELLETKKPIIQISTEFGFETHAAYSKAFKNYFGASPSTVRKQNSAPKHVEVNHQKIEKRRVKMEPRIVILPDQRVVYAEEKGVVARDFTKAADRAFDIVVAYLTKSRQWNLVGDCLGICPDDSDTTPLEDCRYLGGFKLKPNVDFKESKVVKTMIFQGGKFAVFNHTGSYETLWQTWTAIYHDWLPSSGFQLMDVMPYEVYLDDKHKTPSEKLRTDIYIAIE